MRLTDAGSGELLVGGQGVERTHQQADGLSNRQSTPLGPICSGRPAMRRFLLAGLLLLSQIGDKARDGPTGSGKALGHNLPP